VRYKKRGRLHTHRAHMDWYTRIKRPWSATQASDLNEITAQRLGIATQAAPTPPQSISPQGVEGFPRPSLLPHTCAPTQRTAPNPPPHRKRAANARRPWRQSASLNGTRKDCSGSRQRLRLPHGLCDDPISLELPVPPLRASAVRLEGAEGEREGDAGQLGSVLKQRHGARDGHGGADRSDANHREPAVLQL